MTAVLCEFCKCVNAAEIVARDPLSVTVGFSICVLVLVLVGTCLQYWR